MWRVSYLLCLFVLHQVDENSAQVSHPYIVSIKLRLQEERIPRLLAESFTGNNSILAPYFDYSHISLNDVAEIIGNTNVPLKETLEELAIELGDCWSMMCRDTLIEVVRVANINVHHLYSTFVQFFLSDPMNDVPKILNSLKIDNHEFATIVVFGTDKQLLDIILEGSYTKKNIQEVLKVVNQDVSLNGALNFLKFARLGEALIKIKNASSTMHVIDCLKSLLVTDKVVKFLNLLNVSASDFYRNKAFGTVLTKIVDTREELLGSAVSSKSIITNSDSKTLIDYSFLRNFSHLVATSIENPDIQHTVLETKIPDNSSIAILRINGELKLHTFLNISSNTETENFINCSYISLSSSCNSLYIENVNASLKDSQDLIIKKSNSTRYHIGSPLICGKYLYGVADWDYDSSISFILIYSKSETYNNENSAEGYLYVVVNFVKRVPTLVLDSICNVLEVLNFNICSNKIQQ